MPTSTTQRLAVLGVIGPIIFVIGIAIAATQYEGYSHIEQKISELGSVTAEYPWIQNTNFYLLALTVIGFSFAVHRAIDGGKGSVIGPVLIGMLGFSSAGLNAVYPCDASCDGITAAGKLHLATGITGFLSMIAGLIIISRRMARVPAWKTYSRYTFINGIVALILFFSFGATSANDDIIVDGLVQRLFAASLLSWIFLTGLKILRDPEPAD